MMVDLNPKTTQIWTPCDMTMNHNTTVAQEHTGTNYNNKNQDQDLEKHFVMMGRLHMAF